MIVRVPTHPRQELPEGWQWGAWLRLSDGGEGYYLLDGPWGWEAAHGVDLVAEHRSDAELLGPESYGARVLQQLAAYDDPEEESA